jgi:hypothetical protein
LRDLLSSATTVAAHRFTATVTVTANQLLPPLA